MDSSLIEKYFPALTETQRDQFAQLAPLYEHWNAQINVVSRKDIDQIYVHHVLHSLGLVKVMQFLPQMQVLDLGCGGGFPGIPLAIFFPETNFHLVDSIGKKIKVVQEVATALNLKNVKAEQARAETLKGPYDFVVSRAVAPWEELRGWSEKLIRKGKKAELPNGWLLLKGGDLDEEFKSVSKIKVEYPLATFFDDPFFETKKVIYVPR